MARPSEDDPVQSFRAKLCADVTRWLEYHRVELPCGTHDAFVMLRLLGYCPTRRRVDKALERGEFKIESPTGRWRWNIDDIVDYGMLLERLRAWAPGMHQAKKTCFEIAADAELEAAGVLNLQELSGESLEQLLSRLVDVADVQQGHVLGILIDRCLPEGTPDLFFAVLGDIERADSAEARQAIADKFLTLASAAGYVKPK